MSGVKIPAFDNTLGALFIGSSIATILYGIIFLQTFLYITSARAREDAWWLKSLVYLLFALDSAHQLTLTASIYKFLVSDFLNPLLIPSAGPGSGEIFTLALSTIEAISILLVQLFFCWRIWMFSRASLKIEYNLLFTVLAVSLALLSFASSTDLAVQGFRHRFLTANNPSFILSYKLSASTRVAFDVMVTIAMTIALNRARSSGDLKNSRTESTDHIITILTLFTVNTNLITACLSISELVTFLTLPKAAVYGGLGFLSIKTYLNSFLAVLNSRDYLREKFDLHDKIDRNISTISTTVQTNFAILPLHSVVEGSSSSASAGGTGTYDLSTADQHNSNLKQ